MADNHWHGFAKEDLDLIHFLDTLIAMHLPTTLSLLFKNLGFFFLTVVLY